MYLSLPVFNYLIIGKKYIISSRQLRYLWIVLPSTVRIHFYNKTLKCHKNCQKQLKQNIQGFHDRQI